MLDEYYEIYRDLSDLYRSEQRWRVPPYGWPLELYPFEPPRLARWASDAIDEVLAELQLTQRLRPDAKHFLLINLHQMVLLPVAAGGGANAPPPEELRAMMKTDIRTIIGDAIEESSQDERDEITGGALLRSIARRWSDLKLNSLRVWGASRHE